MAALTRYYTPRTFASPLEAVDRLFRDPFFSTRGFAEVATPAGFQSNLYETADAYVLQASLPGVKEESLAITTRENVVTLEGTVEVTAPENARGLWVGLRGGAFRRQFTLPGEVDADTATAVYNSGLLTLTLPKHARAGTRTIRVTSAQEAAPVATEEQTATA